MHSTHNKSVVGAVVDNQSLLKAPLSDPRDIVVEEVIDDKVQTIEDEEMYMLAGSYRCNSDLLSLEQSQD